MIIFYVLFALSVFFPIYTYALYPLIIRLLPCIEYKMENIEPAVCVVVVGENADEKIMSVKRCDYPNMEVLKGDYNTKTKSEVTVFVDTDTELDLRAISEIVKPFADERIGCVVGQQTNPERNSVFWKYENKVRLWESRIGRVSGAPKSLFAVRGCNMPAVDAKILNKPFYISTKVSECGKAVVYRETAKAYEGVTDKINFEKHVKDAAGYWQSLRLLPRMLSSFFCVSHRILKWFVWLNLVISLVSSVVLGSTGSFLMAILACSQIVGYICLIVLGRKKMGGFVGKLIGIGYYFVSLNLAYFVGMFKVKVE